MGNWGDGSVWVKWIFSKILFLVRLLWLSRVDSFWCLAHCRHCKDEHEAQTREYIKMDKCLIVQEKSNHIPFPLPISSISKPLKYSYTIVTHTIALFNKDLLWRAWKLQERTSQILPGTWVLGGAGGPNFSEELEHSPSRCPWGRRGDCCHLKDGRHNLTKWKNKSEVLRNYLCS